MADLICRQIIREIVFSEVEDLYLNIFDNFSLRYYLLNAVIISLVIEIVFILEIRLISSLVGIIEKHSKSDQKKQS